jgi:hypothetical protein
MRKRHGKNCAEKRGDLDIDVDRMLQPIGDIALW